MTGKPPRHRRQVLVNTLANTAANGWMILVSLISLPLLLHGLGTEAFGTWALLLTFSATSGWLSLADFGLGVATVRASARHLSLDDRHGLGQVVGTALAMYLALGLTCSIAFGLIAPQLLPAVFRTPEDLVDAFRVSAAVFAVQILFDLLAGGTMAALEGLQRLDRARMIDTTNRTLTAGATVVVALAGGGLVGVAVTSAGASLVTVVIGAVVLRRSAELHPTLSRARARELARYGSQAGVLRTSGVLHRTMDRIVVGIVLGPASVTIVEIATQLQNGVAALLSATTQVATSSASWLHARDEHERLRELFLRGTKYSTLATVPVAAAVMVLAGPIIGFWVGSQFEGAVVPLALAMVYLITQAPVAVGSNLLQGIGRIRAVMWPAVAGVTVNLVTSIVLVRAMGVTGAFLGTLVGGSVLTPFVLRNVLDALAVPLRRFWADAVLPSVPVLVAAVVGALTVVLLPLGDLATTVLGGAVGLAAAGVVALVWSTDRDERHEILGSLRRPTA